MRGGGSGDGAGRAGFFFEKLQLVEHTSATCVFIARISVGNRVVAVV